MNTVHWMNLRAGAADSLEKKFTRLCKKIGLPSIICKGDLVAVKVHVGERGNLAYVRHNYAGLAVDEIRNYGGKPFLTDTNTLYSGYRHNGVDHSETAQRHGYSDGAAGAPFIAADGLRGLDFEELPVSGRRVKKARIASAICQADKLVMLSHFKGHGEMGFGGAIKNLAMGCAAVPGKLELHSSSQPLVSPEKCVGCRQCLRRCPVGAIAMKLEKAVIDFAKCIGCGQCVAACNAGAMNVKWEEHGEALVEKVGEYAAAVLGRFAGKARFINFATAISPDCDCWGYNDLPIVQDVGILASDNPLALDRATLDLVNKSPAISGSALPAGAAPNVFDALHPGQKSEYIFEYCKKLGMSDEYELEEVK